MTQNTLFGDEIETESDLFKRFLVPPFSYLDTRIGSWQNRKKRWIALGVNEQNGRADCLTYINIKKESPFIKDLKAKWKGDNKTSHFDPLLAELLYLWFTKEGYIVLDPFCGGSVRGIVADKLKRKYIGIDIRQEQITANKEQGKKILYKDDLWICDDSKNIPSLISEKVDFVFSCPPYGNLETYSDNPSDISTMEYPDFIISYAEIINKACEKLKDNRFAVFVCGNFRNKQGNYYNFVADTITLFEQNNLKFYNEIILLNNIATLVLTCGKKMQHSRKISKIHQNVLVFIKGDAKKATEELGEVKLINPFKQDNRNI